MPAFKEIQKDESGESNGVSPMFLKGHPAYRILVFIIWVFAFHGLSLDCETKSYEKSGILVIARNMYLIANDSKTVLWSPHTLDSL